ncbi:hypothetical protein BGZ96_009190 [Linnemannia gamsii]|uniref:Histone deacetylase complex subunit SAP30 Sin3 binding domain-containing protein n=1 Tax=Linnemannia gamsii TaxID=64522 RepID=A0ABQ7JYV1_9FUNG|nr:hypothetical protein BGZ96_009190 [Linnemannia gamsii]
MAPKQKATDGGPSSGSKSSSAHGNSHSNSEGRSGHANGSSSERGGGGSSAAHDRASSSTNANNNNSNSAAAGSSSGAGGGASANGTGGGSHTEKGGSSSHTGGSGTTGSGTKRKAESPLITVDFSALDVSALRRYCRLNHLKPKSKTREALVTAATTHWNSTSAQEVDSVAYFLFAVKHRHNVLKLTMPLP